MLILSGYGTGYIGRSQKIFYRTRPDLENKSNYARQQQELREIARYKTTKLFREVQEEFYSSGNFNPSNKRDNSRLMDEYNRRAKAAWLANKNKAKSIIQSIQIAKPVQVTPTIQVAKPVQVAPTIQVAKPVQVAPTVQVAKPVQVAPTVQVAKPVQVAPTVQVAKPVQVTKPVQTLQITEIAKPIKTQPEREITICRKGCESGYVESVKNCKIQQPVHTLQVTEITKSIKPVEPIRDASQDYEFDVIQHQLKRIEGDRLRIDPYTLKLSPYGETTVKIGSKNTDVSTLQNLLKAKGYFSGSVSGTFDTATKDAVVSFQKSSGLIADGIVGPQTWSALTGKTSEGVDLRSIINRYSGGLIPEYVDFFGTRIPTIFIGIGLGSLIGFAVYKRMQKKEEMI